MLKRNETYFLLFYFRSLKDQRTYVQNNKMITLVILMAKKMISHCFNIARCWFTFNLYRAGPTSCCSFFNTQYFGCFVQTVTYLHWHWIKLSFFSLLYNPRLLGLSVAWKSRQSSLLHVCVYEAEMPASQRWNFFSCTSGYFVFDVSANIYI